jgi:isopenicillin-N epimerase
MGRRAGKGAMDRRELLLAASGAAVGAACTSARPFLASDSLGLPQPASGAATTDWRAVRRQFRLTPDVVHLTAFFIASHPSPVREAIERHRRGLDEDPTRYLMEHGTPLRLAVVEQAASFFGAQVGGVALTDSTTMALAILYNGLKLSEGDEILHEQSGYYSSVFSLRYKQESSGVRLREVELYKDPAQASVGQLTDRLISAIGPRTRVLALTWVHSDTGLKLPIRAIADRLAEVNEGREAAERILLCVDGVHGLGVEDVTLGELGCDFFAAGTHKWMFGPRGTGVLYSARPEAFDLLRPTIPPFGAQSTPGLRMTPGGFHSFEMRWATADAFRFIEGIGKAQVTARTRELASRLKEGLSEVRGVRLLTPRPPELSAGIVAFNVDGWVPVRAAARLGERGFVVAESSYGVSSIRASPSILNTSEELDRFVRAVAEL